jgi:predicted signal transduction protein with EAL and GGDEF domain
MSPGAAALAASIGVAMAPRDGDTPELLLRRADTALHAAKDGGRDRCVFFEPEMDLRVQRLVSIDHELQHALSRHEFRLAYQPVLDSDGNIVKVEALLRWTSPVLGDMPPDIFVPIAEESGQIVAIGAWVLRQAASDMAERERLGAPPLTVSVNVSARQIADPNFPHHVRNALSAAGLPPERLELELTERLLIGETPHALSAIADLYVQGIRFAVDDFGVGYSSLSYLTRFPFKTIKIDRSFARELQDNPRHIEMFRAILAIGRSLDAQVVAEGVETEEVARLLVGIGCTLQQGFVHARPCPIGEVAAAAARSPFARADA